MTPVAVLAAGAISAQGTGSGAYAVGAPGARPESRVTLDASLAEAGLRHARCARALVDVPNAARPTTLLRTALRLLVDELDALRPSWRRERVGVCVGSSSGGMPSYEVWRSGSEPRARAEASSYFGPVLDLRAALGIEPVRVSQVLAACASSTVALGLACGWLEAGHCDLVFAGGYDALAVFVAAGFEALGATTASVPRPFCRARDGMALGEGAALLALARPRVGDPEPALGYLAGFGVACDALHVTAPDRRGDGLARAAQTALADAGLPAAAMDLVSAHGTATAYNDAAEAAALRTLFGARASSLPVHGFKSIVGHTLGAAGALETLALCDAARRSIVPASLAEGELDPELSVQLLRSNGSAQVRRGLKLSTAFGGLNAALVVARDRAALGAAPERAVARRARLRALGAPVLARDPEELASRAVPGGLDLTRLDLPSALVLAAISGLLEQAGLELPERSGLVVGSALCCLEVNGDFLERMRQRAGRVAEPRRFPATSPNVCAGRAAIAWGLHGPVFTVGAGLQAAEEALLCAADLIEAGRADSVIVVAVEDAGPNARALCEAAGWPLPEHGACAALLDAGSDGEIVDTGRLGLLRGPERAPAARRAGWPALRAALLAP